MTKCRLWFALALLTGSISCAEERASLSGDTSESESESAQTGTIALNLVGADSLGMQYRLREAEFLVASAYYSGLDGGTTPQTTTLSTESNPDAERLSVRVVPGPYTVTLQGGWYMERLTAAGPERVEKVLLLSELRQQTWVMQDSVSEVIFQFGVDGDEIDFRHGDLGVGIDIERPEDGRPDAGVDGGADGGADGGMDAGLDAGSDIETDAGVDAEVEADAEVDALDGDVIPIPTEEEDEDDALRIF